MFWQTTKHAGTTDNIAFNFNIFPNRCESWIVRALNTFAHVFDVISFSVSPLCLPVSALPLSFFAPRSFSIELDRESLAA